ncbi:MAG: hypothetical protein WCC17_13495 [Candidatus Nitrosopolaris sp.]
MILNITAAIASSFGIIVVCIHGVDGAHGRSYLFLTLGIISWFAADLTLAYYYFALGIEEQIQASVTDVLWFIGYLFLAAHLFTVLRFIRSRIKLMTIIITSILSLLFITYIGLNLHTRSLAEDDFTAFFVTIAYPILDLMLFVPSTIILISLRKDDVQSVTWFFLSLSLLINAVADEGYLNDFVGRRLHHLLFWNIFYVADFIIMAGALFWYYKFHISPEQGRMKITG